MNSSSSERTITDIYCYYLIRDKVMRNIVSSQRDDYVGLRCYISNVAEGLLNS